MKIKNFSKILSGISKKFLTFIIFSFILISALAIGTFLISQKKQEFFSFPSFEEKVNYKVGGVSWE